MDATDKKILHALQRDARTTVAELADSVALSTSPCWRRIRLLEGDGVIAGYHAALSRERLGYGVLGFVHLGMDNHTPAVSAAFEREVQALPEVLSCYNLSGRYDYQLEIIATDLAAFSEFVRTKVRALPGVREISTSFSLKELKRTNILPIP